MGLFSGPGNEELGYLESTEETYADFDYVEIWDYDERANKFNYRWRDDFNSFVEERWEKADGSKLPKNDTTFDAGNVEVKNGLLKMKLNCVNCADGSDQGSDSDDSDSDEESDHSGDESHEGSDHGSDDESDHGSDDESDHGSDHSDDESHHSGDESDHSGHDSHEDDFHVINPPQDGTLDAAIEKATRVGVAMVKMQLDQFSESMAHYLQ